MQKSGGVPSLAQAYLVWKGGGYHMAYAVIAANAPDLQLSLASEMATLNHSIPSHLDYVWSSWHLSRRARV